MDYDLFAPCPRGLEPLLRAELESLGADARAAVDGGVVFRGDLRTVYRANLESRLASRVLMKVDAGGYRNEADLYARARRIDWPTWFDCGCSIRVALAAIQSPLKSLDFATLRIKDAICDGFRAATGARPNVDTRTPDVRIHAFLDQRTASFYIDTSGDPLFKRGWRTSAVEAPLRENLAAGILRLAGFIPGTPLLDPMCGGGTFLLEAATMAAGIAPGAGRSFGFERLRNFDASGWDAVRAAATRDTAPDAPLNVFGSDQSPRAIRATEAALGRAGLADRVTLKCADILDIEAPAPAGIMIANPPYGVRIGELDALAVFYPKLGTALKRHFAGWRCFFFTADMRMPKLMGLKPARRTPLYNGALECRLYEFAMVEGRLRTDRALSATTGESAAEESGARDQRRTASE